VASIAGGTMGLRAVIASRPSILDDTSRHRARIYSVAIDRNGASPTRSRRGGSPGQRFLRTKQCPGMLGRDRAGKGSHGILRSI
jgi:hypothetical protein